MKNFLNISDLDSNELRKILDEAKKRKSNRINLNKSAFDQDKPMEGKSMIMIFEKPSTRTRISFDIAVKQLGGTSIILNPDGIHYGKGDETLKDTAKVLSEYGDIIMIRTSSHKNLEEFSRNLSIPLINGLSNESHPCQVISDILTYEELMYELRKRAATMGGNAIGIYDLNENKEIIYANKEIDVKNSLKVRYEFMKQTNLLSSVTADIFRCKSDA